MGKYSRVFIIGHPGSGKAVLGNALAEKLGWHFVDIDFNLEFKIGKMLIDILGEEGIKHFYQCQFELLNSLINLENVVVATGGAIVCSDKNRSLLLSEFSLYLEVSLPVQLQRLIRNQPPILISNSEHLLKRFHQERDLLYVSVAKMTINTDNISLEEHIEHITQRLEVDTSDKKKVRLEKKDLVLFHKKKHVPVYLSEQQAMCIKLLSAGKSSKQIARDLNMSHRTVEGYIAKAMSLLGCKSSKELIALYLDRT